MGLGPLQSGRHRIRALQCHAGGQYVAQYEMADARCHRCVDLAVFLDIGKHADVGKFGERGAAMGQCQHAGTAAACQGGSSKHVPGAATVGDQHGDVAGSQQGGGHAEYVRIGVGRGGNAQAEELVLDVECDDARIAAAVELDAPCAGQQADRVLDLVGRQCVTHAHQRGDGAVEHLAGDIGGAIAGFHVLVDERRAAADVLGELELEFLEAVIAKRGAEACNGRLGNAGALRQLGHGQSDDAGAVAGHIVGQPAFGRA